MNIKDIEIKIQTVSSHFLQSCLQVVTALVLGLLTTHLLQRIFLFEILSYIFCLIVFSSTFFSFVRHWPLLKLVVFNIILILSAFVLRGY
jgi:hypothetical protein